jgi:hypothetical protein
LAHRASAKQPQVSEQLVEEAIRLMPYEHYYRRQLIFDLLGRAIADIRRLPAAPERYPTVARNLAVAELEARKMLAEFPRNAWSLAALANVLQVRALRFLRPYAPAAGEAAAQESNELFLRAHGMFPAQPLLLRNWAQLLLDQGNGVDAYRLLDLMENLIPHELESYAERIEMANQLSDYKTVSDTLARASKALEPALFKRLLGVAKLQQK